MTNTIRVRAMESINSRNIADFLHSLDSIQQTILLTKSGTTVNAKSMLGLLTLSINEGNELDILAKCDLETISKVILGRYFTRIYGV